MTPEWTPVPLQAGCWPDLAPRKGLRFFREASRVRFTPQLEPHRGWERVLNPGNSYQGKARGIVEWVDNSGYQLAAIGTHKGVWAVFDSEARKITPIEEYAFLTNAIDTVAASTTFTVNKTAHGYVAGMYVRFPTGPTIDGVVLTAAFYEITTVTTNAFTFTAGAAASAGGSGLGGSLLDMDVFLRPGLEFGTAGQGYGTGNYDVGLYGGTLASASYKARIWSGGAIGELLCLAPRGGAMYEFGPSFGASDLNDMVTSGSTMITSNWTYGTGWAHDSGNNEADATTLTIGAALTTSLYQSVTISSGRWYRLRFTVSSLTAGAFDVYCGTVKVGTATAAGRYALEFYNNTSTAQNLRFAANVSNTSGAIKNVSLKMSDVLCRRTTAPAAINALMTSPQGHAIAMGCTTQAGVFDPLAVRNCAALDTSNWTPSFSNEAREFFLRNGGFLQQGVNGADGQVFAGTDKSIWEGKYVGQPTIWDWQCRDPKNGLLGARSMVYSDSRLWFATRSKQFKVYDGKTTTIFCPGERTVFDNIAPSQEDACAFHEHSDDEVWFIYPTQPTNEVERYAALKKTDLIWQSFGYYSRTAWAPGNGYPVAAESGQLYYHEKGYSADGADALDWQARATAIQIGNGQTTGEVSGYRPDTSDQRGPFNVRFYAYLKNMASIPTDTGNIAITSATEENMSFMVDGSMMDMEYTGNTYVRIGDPSIYLADTGNPA